MLHYRKPCAVSSHQFLETNSLQHLKLFDGVEIMATHHNQVCFLLPSNRCSGSVILLYVVLVFSVAQKSGRIVQGVWLSVRNECK